MAGEPKLDCMLFMLWQGAVCSSFYICNGHLGVLQASWPAHAWPGGHQSEYERLIVGDRKWRPQSPHLLACCFGLLPASSCDYAQPVPMLSCGVQAQEGAQAGQLHLRCLR